MPSVFTDYEKLVLQDYKFKRSKSFIPSGLMHPTRAKLKKACSEICKGELSPQDKKAIRDFCKKWDETKTFSQNITAYDEDKFRPLSDYLTDITESKNTDPIYIELLACLINFPHRPYDYTIDYEPLLKMQAGAMVIEQESGTDNHTGSNTIIIEPYSEINNSSLQDNEIPVISTGPAPDVTERTRNIQNVPLPDDGVINTLDNNQKKENKSALSPLLKAGVVLIFLLMGYWWYRFEISRETGGCMYWAGDHFQRVPCDKKIPDTYVVALDTFRLRHFKKITAVKTITHRDKGCVWYSKIGNHLEYFTADGKHPIVMNYELKPITDYIIDTHIHPPGEQIN